MKTNTLNHPAATASECGSSLVTPIPSSADLKAAIPRSSASAVTIDRSREAIQAILKGEDAHRFIVICGPCSIHNANAAYDYAQRLEKLAREVEDELLVVMRTYFEKPRSVVGWKGLLYDPELEGSAAAASGLALARRILASITELGLPCATEFLNPILAAYQEDFISYGSIGARTVESQIHRELAAGLAMPVGMKNNLAGDIGSSINAVQAVNRPHSVFLNDEYGRPSIAQVKGNPFAHIFLRGGQSGPNLDSASIRKAARDLNSQELRRPVMVDCSHANSGKDFRRQGSNARRVVDQFLSECPETGGLMLESNLESGRQNFQAGCSHALGQSITDGCIGWGETESLIREIALKVKRQSLQKKSLPSL